MRRCAASWPTRMLDQRDEAGKQVFPTGGTRVLAYPAAHYAVADGKARLRFRLPEPAHGRGSQRCGEEARRRGTARRRSKRTSRRCSRSATIGSRCRSTKAPGRCTTASTATCTRCSTSNGLIHHARRQTPSPQLAARTARERASRARRCEHFSKRYPDMTIEDGYAISRAWVKTEDRRRPRRQGPQDRPDLARDAAGQPDHRARLRHAAGRHVLRAGRRHPARPLHRAARRGRARLRARQARCKGRASTIVRRAGGHRLRDAGHRDHRRAHRAVRPPHQGDAQGVRHHQPTTRPMPASCSAAARCSPTRVDLRWVGALLLQERRGRGNRRSPPACSTIPRSAWPGWPTSSRPGTNAWRPARWCWPARSPGRRPPVRGDTFHADYGPLGPHRFRFA